MSDLEVLINGLSLQYLKFCTAVRLKHVSTNYCMVILYERSTKCVRKIAKYELEGGWAQNLVVIMPAHNFMLRC